MQCNAMQTIQQNWRVLLGGADAVCAASWLTSLSSWSKMLGDCLCFSRVACFPANSLPFFKVAKFYSVPEVVLERKPDRWLPDLSVQWWFLSPKSWRSGHLPSVWLKLIGDAEIWQWDSGSGLSHEGMHLIFCILGPEYPGLETTTVPHKPEVEVPRGLDFL